MKVFSDGEHAHSVTLELSHLVWHNQNRWHQPKKQQVPSSGKYNFTPVQCGSTSSYRLFLFLDTYQEPGVRLTIKKTNCKDIVSPQPQI